MFGNTPVTFVEAKTACANYSGVLASVHSQKEAQSLFMNGLNHDFYIGLWVPTNNDGDRYEYLDGTQPDWAVWDEQSKEFGACTVGRNGPVFVKEPCEYKARGYICQIATPKWDRL